MGRKYFCSLHWLNISAPLTGKFEMKKEPSLSYSSSSGTWPFAENCPFQMGFSPYHTLTRNVPKWHGVPYLKGSLTQEGCRSLSRFWCPVRLPSSLKALYWISWGPIPVWVFPSHAMAQGHLQVGRLTTPAYTPIPWFCCNSMKVVAQWRPKHINSRSKCTFFIAHHNTHM